jgi:hypothetical protein
VNSLAATIDLPLSAILALSQECWRLQRIAASPDTPHRNSACHRSFRVIAAILAEQGIQFEDYYGRPYDQGLAAEVLDAIEDPQMTPGAARIDETVSPTITWRGCVVIPGQIVVRQGPASLEA